MPSFFSRQNTRCTAIVMVCVWLLALGIGVANACVAQVQHHEHADEVSLASDKAVCVDVCIAAQDAVVKVNPLDAPSNALAIPVVQLAALTIALVDLNDRLVPSTPPTWCESPLSIRFQRLTI